MIGRKIAGVPGYEQGVLASRGGPDDRVWQPQPVSAPDGNGLIRHGLCDGEEFEPVQKVSEQALFLVTLRADQDLHPRNQTDGGRVISEEFFARRLDPAKIVNENVCIDDGVH
jgi:hypothetical protein